jgi:uncharacterized protein (DUF1697 family)
MALGVSDPDMATRKPKPQPVEKYTHLALLRGINVGGKHVIPMAAVGEMFKSAGCSNVRTYIQSGNVAFAASASAARKVASSVTRLIAGQFGFEPAIVVRTAAEFAALVRENPFLKIDPAGAALHVGFMAEAPAERRIAALDPQRSPGDGFAVRGREIYLHLPNGVLATKLTNAYFDSALSTTCTFRNWRTVLKLAAMLQADA